MMLAMNLIVMKRGWSVTIISVSSVFITASLMFIFVPIGRHLIGEGGECAGAAASVITSEACVLTAMLTRFDKFPLDRRNLAVFGKSLGIGAFVLIGDRYLRFLGAARLPIEAVTYAVLAFALGVVRVSELKQVVRLLRHRGDPLPQVTLAES
jgi:hypothetical protein